MKKHFQYQFILLFIVILFTSFSVLKRLSGKIVNNKNEPIENAEIIIPEYELYLKTNTFGNFFISNKYLLKDFTKNKIINLEVRAKGYKTLKIKIDKINDLEIRDRLKPFILETSTKEKPKKEENKIQENKQDTIKEIFQNIDKTIYKDGNTTNNINTLNNNGNGTVHIGNEYTINEGDKVIKTTIIKEKVVKVIPFEDRDCAKKKKGYLYLINKSNVNYEIKLSKRKSGWYSGFFTYNIYSNSTKFMTLESDYYYDIGGDNLSIKSHRYAYVDFKDNVFINPCDTQKVIIR